MGVGHSCTVLLGSSGPLCVDANTTHTLLGVEGGVAPNAGREILVGQGKDIFTALDGECQEAVGGDADVLSWTV